MSRPALSLADRLRAFATLRPRGNASIAAMSELLQPRSAQGEVPIAASRAARETILGVAADFDEEILSRRSADTPSAPTTPSVPRDQAATRGLPTAPSRVTPLPREPFSVPAIASAPVSLGSPGRAPAPPAPIIEPVKGRAVLAPLATSMTVGLDVDVDRLIERIANGRNIDQVPRRPTFSSRRGAQLLIDSGAALVPLTADLEGVVWRLQRVIGVDRLRSLYFAGCPGRGVGVAERDTWKAWEAPAPGVPVILISDLGAVGPRGNNDWAAPSEWLRFARSVRAAGCPVLALVPYPVGRFDEVLARAITVVPWNERLDAARVRRILRDARRDRDDA